MFHKANDDCLQGFARSVGAARRAERFGVFLTDLNEKLTSPLPGKKGGGLVSFNEMEMKRCERRL
jgi:hypothetical protein